jgi:hypothetical protein
LGLKKVIIKPSTEGDSLAPNAVIYRPKVILECTVQEALVPPLSRAQKKGLRNRGAEISKGQSMTFGPGGVFAGKKGTESKRESISRTSSSSNMFSMLSRNTEAADTTVKGEAFTQIIG